MTDWNLARNQINSGVNWLSRGLEDAELREKRAANAGAELAAEVYRFIEDPEGVGTDALEAARVRFLEQHSSNFCEPLPTAT